MNRVDRGGIARLREQAQVCTQKPCLSPGNSAGTLTAVPEPATWALLAVMGALATISLRRLRNHAQR